MILSIIDSVLVEAVAKFVATEATTDAVILDELSGRAEASLAHLWQLLYKQGNGESGPLLVNGYANIFYLRGTDGALWVAHPGWDDSGWALSVAQMNDPIGWCEGYRVFAPA